MTKGRLINVILICLVNGIFSFAGIFLNCLVIVCLWKCSHLRKKFCYFLILILSCCDLIVVIVGHPLTIGQALVWTMDDRRILESLIIFETINSVLVGFSSTALLTMNMERYLATVHPLLHRRSVTKRRIVAVVAVFHTVDVVLTTAKAFLPGSANDISSILAIIIFVILIIFMNLKMFMVAMSAKRNGTTNKRSVTNFKAASTCLLAVLCFCCCSIPLIFHFFFKLFSTFSDDALISFYLWATTAVNLDSTFNCFLFFWRNKLLRVEGKKILKCGKFGSSQVHTA